MPDFVPRGRFLDCIGKGDMLYLLQRCTLVSLLWRCTFVHLLWRWTCFEGVPPSLKVYPLWRCTSVYLLIIRSSKWERLSIFFYIYSASLINPCHISLSLSYLWDLIVSCSMCYPRRRGLVVLCSRGEEVSHPNQHIISPCHISLP